MVESSEPDLRRTAYLHEAGHAVVAIEHGLVVRELQCDGETSHGRSAQPPRRPRGRSS